ncbi:MAG: VacJ family lipoprotein [Deltaproteobacteria bacterium]|nr:VacJ family lipoprotein [Deltaproteobacteria bacterium]
MKPYLTFILSSIFLVADFAHGQQTSSVVLPQDLSAPQQVLPASTSDQSPVKDTGNAADAINDEYKDEENLDYANDTFKEERVEIADPLEPINRAMHQFNDKLYFWALKPVAQGYKTVVPEPARVSVKNFFSNLAFPARFLSCLLQADLSGAATEAGRFTINTVWGIGGLMDPSSGKELDLQKQDTDLCQTLGVWGVEQGFYIVWPVLGPSSPRDSVSIAGDFFLYPVSYINPWYAWLGVRTYEEVNATSLRIGDYEALKNAAIDPYVAFRDAYVQYRYKKVKARKAKWTSSTMLTGQYPSANPELTGKGN